MRKLQSLYPKETFMREVKMKCRQLVKSLIPKKLRPAIYYILLNFFAFLFSIRDLLYKNDSKDIPLPPPLLRHRVHNRLDRQSFLDVGKTCAENIEDSLKLINRDLYSFENILDFGCGCGRVLRHFDINSESSHFYGTDIDEEAIGWCKKSISHASFTKNAPFPPLSFTEGIFDLVYAISVFTHIDEDCQFAWLKELKRITKPNAILILTTHGNYVQSSLSREDKISLKEIGFLYKVVSTGKFKRDGLPDFYQVSYQTKQYVIKTWSKYFNVRIYLERGINNHQDLILLENVDVKKEKISDSSRSI